MSNYQSSDTFQQLNSTESNGYNLFPGAYMSKGVGGARTKRAKSLKQMKKEENNKNNKKGIKKGGDCGCSKMQNPLSGPFKGGKRNKGSHKTKNNNTKKNKR